MIVACHLFCAYYFEPISNILILNMLLEFLGLLAYSVCVCVRARAWPVACRSIYRKDANGVECKLNIVKMYHLHNILLTSNY
jgi:hypothetical protein